MPKLNIAHHKSYHPYKADNIERVRRDEERAAALEAGDRAKVVQADSEARIALLRRKAKKGKSAEEDAAEKKMDRQLKGKGRAVDGQAHEAEPERESRATIVRPPTTAPPARTGRPEYSFTTKEGHFNFWMDAEQGRPVASTSKGNKDYQAEKKAEDDKWEAQITMYLKDPPKSWYNSTDGLRPEERKRTDDQRIERTYKDNQAKNGQDPLATMQAYLTRRDEIRAAQERQRADPWNDTPRTLRPDRTPIQPKLLGPKKGSRRDELQRKRTPSPELGPPRPPPPAKSIQQAAATRESSERQRAKALLASKRAASSTPRSEFSYETGMYNREATRQARGYRDVRWDEDSRGSGSRRR